VENRVPAKIEFCTSEPISRRACEHKRQHLATVYHLVLALVAFAVVAQQAIRSVAAPMRFPDEFLLDAELTDVTFVDPDVGWAVGDRGVIWHTEDGGRHWRLQPSPVPCRLESVSFVDDRNGWIVGGWSHPYTHKSTAVVLRTTDGGQHWKPIPRLSLPGLKRVRFFDLRTGWALGNASAIYPAGVFHTNDGGRSWSSVSATTNCGWLTGDFVDAQVGAVAGYGGTAGFVQRSGMEPATSLNVGLRHVRCLRLSLSDIPTHSNPNTPIRQRRLSGWLAGDGGLVLFSADGGRSWHESVGGLPSGMYDQFDYRALAALGESCWIAGSPGTRVLHSSDGGRTWQVFETGQSLPIRAMVFLDANRGWAVGSLGTILATRDGGRTWMTQHQGGTRAALLGIFSAPTNVPLELFAKLAGNEGYLSAVEILCRQDIDVPPSGETSLEARTHEALVAVGASQADTAWSFPLRQSGLSLSGRSIIDGWSQVHRQHGYGRLQEYIVRKIRQWQPEVILTEPASPHGDDPPTHLVNQTVLAAVDLAADADAYPDQLTVAGLAPWKIKRVVCSLGADVKGSLDITASQLAPRLGCSLSDQARRGWELLCSTHRPPPQTYGFRVLVNRLPEEMGKRHFFSGISLSTGGNARRMLGAPPPGDLRSIGRLTQQRRNIQQLLKHTAVSSHNRAAWLGQAEDLVRGLDASAGGDILFELADSLRISDQPDLAADVLDFLVRRYPDHPLCETALIWLVQYYGSAEAGWAFRREGSLAQVSSLPGTQDRNVRQVGNLPHDGNSVGSRSTHEPAAFSEPVRLPHTNSVESASFDSPVVGKSKPASNIRFHKQSAAIGSSPEDRARRAVGFAQMVRNSYPSLFAEPELRFPLAVADRRSGLGGEPERYYHFVSGTRNRDAWWSCAQSELWLARPSRQPPKAMAKCTKASQKPRLDGRLNDEVWQTCSPVPLASPHRDDADWPANAMLAYDDDFLYFAATCRKAANAEYPTSDAPRPRDPELGSRDRIDLLLDVDRDYTTYYRLTVDHRGWCTESCFGIPSWDPEWFVAAIEDRETWTIEAAIAWGELTDSKPNERNAWAAGIQRIVPCAGFQAWTHPSTVRGRPEGFGLLTFE